MYRLRKFARRNRIALGAAGGVVCALLLTMAALGYGYLQVSHERDKTAERETETRAQMLLSGMNAVRKYTANNVRPALQAQSKDYNANFVREMVPGFSAREVFGNFRSDPQYKDFVYKEAAPNPTNTSNRADPFEVALIDQFKSNPNATESSGIREMSGVRNYYIARPMQIKDGKCLDCHTTPETAPPKQLELYGRDGGYGWKMDEIVAAQVVYVPVSEAFRSERRDGNTVIIFAAVALVVGAGFSLVLLRKA